MLQAMGITRLDLILAILFSLIFIGLGLPRFNRVQLPMQIGGAGHGRPGLHWFFNLLALLCWAGAWYTFPATRNAYLEVPRPDWMIIPATFLMLLGLVLVVAGIGRNWKKGVK